MSAAYRVEAKGNEQGIWMTVACVVASDFRSAIHKARKEPTAAPYASWEFWRATITANRTGRNLGRCHELKLPTLTIPTTDCMFHVEQTP